MIYAPKPLQVRLSERGLFAQANDVQIPGIAHIAGRALPRSNEAGEDCMKKSGLFGIKPGISFNSEE